MPRLFSTSRRWLSLYLLVAFALAMMAQSSHGHEAPSSAHLSQSCASCAIGTNLHKLTLLSAATPLPRVFYTQAALTLKPNYGTSSDLAFLPSRAPPSPC